MVFRFEYDAPGDADLIDYHEAPTDPLKASGFRDREELVRGHVQGQRKEKAASVYSRALVLLTPQ